MLDTMVTYLDRYFKPLNIRFYWLDQADIIRDDKYANTVNFDVFNATRAVYDVNNAVNVYFGLVSAYGTGSSFASTPNPTKSSNYVYFNTLDLSPGYSGAYMLKYTIPHEFGHYFGLAHTFDNSNSSIISDRELVTRGPNANCTDQGDYICDTPADPYDRLSTSEAGRWYIDYVNCRLISNLVDANGEKFNPDLKNIMSYYASYCPGDMRFSDGQYARMRLGFNLRLTYTCTGSDFYTITGAESSTPHTSIDRIVNLENGQIDNSNAYDICIGATARIIYSTSGSFQPAETFQVEAVSSPNLYRTLTASYKLLPSEPVVGSPNQLAVRFTDSTLINSQSPFYTIRIRPSTTIALQCLSSIIAINKPGTLRLTFDNTTSDTMTINFNQSVSVRIRPDTENMWLATYGRGRLLANTQQYPYLLSRYTNDQVMNLTYYKTGQIRLLDGFVSCGFVNLAGKLTVVVRPPSLALKQPDRLTVCAGTSVQLPYTSSVSFSNCRAQLSDANGQFTNDSTGIIGTTQQSPIRLQFPSSLANGAYRIRLQVNTPQGWVAALPGEAIQISALPTALLQTPPATILAGDSTRLTLQLTGTSPWQVAFNNGQARTFVSKQESFYVKPIKTTVYQPMGVQDACGPGTVSGSTTITVLPPLASEPLSDENVLRAWPNPTDNDLTVEFSAPASQPVTLRITDEAGRQVQAIDKKGTGTLLRHSLNVRPFPAGIYQLSVERTDGTQTIRFLKK